MSFTRILNVDVLSVTQKELLQRLDSGVLVTPNVDHLVKLQKDREFYDVYRKAEWVVCDSRILCRASKFLKDPLPEAIPGSSFFTQYYLYHKDDKDCRIFLLGAAEGIADKARENINRKTGRDIVVGSHSPSYGFEKNPAECEELVRIVNESGANVLLVRAGALYHDIGKTANPLCFIENETLGAHYHEGLSPSDSAKDIIRHVTDGLAIAEKANLPGVIKEFIVTHHGNTCTAYFYNKYLEQGGNPADASDFCYKGHRPTTKEQIVLMLCDTLEAASRTLKDFSQNNISELVERIFRTKMQDGQFDDADISLKELSILKNVLKEYLMQVYHARVVYPKRLSRNGK